MKIRLMTCAWLIYIHYYYTFHQVPHHEFLHLEGQGSNRQVKNLRRYCIKIQVRNKLLPLTSTQKDSPSVLHCVSNEQKDIIERPVWNIGWPRIPALLFFYFPLLTNKSISKTFPPFLNIITAHSFTNLNITRHNYTLCTKFE